MKTKTWLLKAVFKKANFKTNKTANIQVTNEEVLLMLLFLQSLLGLSPLLEERNCICHLCCPTSPNLALCPQI